MTATKGEAGFPIDDSRSASERAAIRESELRASLATLGVTEHRWLGYSDGGCAAVADIEAAAAVSAIIAEVQPDTVLTFGPDGGTGHPDHVAVCRWTTQAIDVLDPADRPQLLYATRTNAWGQQYMAGMDPLSVMMIEDFQPEGVEPEDLAVWLTCDGELLDRKTSALQAQASQIEPIVAVLGLANFRSLISEEFFRERRSGDDEILSRATAFSRR